MRATVQWVLLVGIVFGGWWIYKDFNAISEWMRGLDTWVLVICVLGVTVFLSLLLGPRTTLALYILVGAITGIVYLAGNLDAEFNLLAGLKYAGLGIVALVAAALFVAGLIGLASGSDEITPGGEFLLRVFYGTFISVGVGLVLYRVLTGGWPEGVGISVF